MDSYLHNNIRFKEQTIQGMKNKMEDKYISMLNIAVTKGSGITSEICFSEWYTSSDLWTGFPGNKPAPKTLGNADSLAFDTLRPPANKEALLPSSNFISFGGRLTDSEEAATTREDLSASLLIACKTPLDIEEPGCNKKIKLENTFILTMKLAR